MGGMTIISLPREGGGGVGFHSHTLKTGKKEFLKNATKMGRDL